MNMDHIIPVNARMDPNNPLLIDPKNIQMLCFSCNIFKFNNSNEWFMSVPKPHQNLSSMPFEQSVGDVLQMLINDRYHERASAVLCGRIPSISIGEEDALRFLVQWSKQQVR